VSRVGESLSVIVLAGGRNRRMGGVDKVSLSVNGSTLLDRVLDAWPLDAQLVVVGPRRTTRRSVTWCREQPPGGGPVSAVAAGLGEAAGRLIALVAGDMPLVGPAVAPLLDAADRSVRDGGAGACLVTPDGRPQPLASCLGKHALTSALPDDPRGQALHSLLGPLDLLGVPAPFEWVLDADTDQDLIHIEELLADHEGTPHA
jgi:molybdopterin-guanine dinucleotide biosynthesis protein A